MGWDGMINDGFLKMKMVSVVQYGSWKREEPVCLVGLGRLLRACFVDSGVEGSLLVTAGSKFMIALPDGLCNRIADSCEI